MSEAIEIRHYVNRAGKDVFDAWLSELADTTAQARVAARINRLAVGGLLSAISATANPSAEAYTNCVSIGGPTTAFIMR